jgi:hypothetical protein
MPESEPADVIPSNTVPSNDLLMPVGAWIRLELPGAPVVGYTYVDQQAGFSAQGWKAQGQTLDQTKRVIVRLPMPGVSWQRLDSNEIRAAGLESPPAWVAEFYGAQPATGTLWGAWREHARLKSLFHPDHPDDLQVFVHDGGPRFSRLPAEAVWVTVRGMDGDVFRGRVLNQPHNLTCVQQGSEIKFVVADGAEFPVMVTDKYLRERNSWVIHSCRKCGFSELFDAPSDFIRVVFPNQPAGAQMSMFTAFCPLCGGVQVVESRSDPSAGSEEHTPTPPARKRPWWRFWG